ncbi:MAG: topoisomerase C-terminal repeat-containing protein, partial [Rhodothermales bacterium]
AARKAVQGRYGKNYLSPQPRQYSGKVRNAQEAHEAIRPAGKLMQTREEKGLSGVEGRLYDLIWKRTVASQMAKARLLFTTATIEAGEDDEAKATFRSSGRQVEFAGFFRAYVEGSDDPEAAIEDRDQPLPPLKEGDTPDCKSVEPLGHETKPPARYTEASLVKMLEGEGIGRPSTYASIMDTIVNRGYVRKQGSQLVPTFTAFAANNVMELQFEQLVDVGFTAGMEQVLDDIAEGGTEAIPYLRDFYNGTTGLETKVETGLDCLDAREVSSISFPKWNGYVVRVGKYGPYVEGEIDGERVTASLPDELAPADVDEAMLEELLKSGNVDDQVLGIHPEADQPVLLKKGPYGPYVQLGDDDQAGKPKRMSLPKGVDAADVDLQMALDLLNLPRVLGDHPESGQPIKASIGRYGPYVQHGSTFASLKKEDDLFSVDLDRALELISEKEAKRKPLRVIGQHPESGDPVEVWSGKYGPYVKHKRTNASLPKDRAPEAVTMEEALDLLAARQASKKKKSGGRKTTSKKGKKTPKAKD